MRTAAGTHARPSFHSVAFSRNSVASATELRACRIEPSAAQSPHSCVCVRARVLQAENDELRIQEAEDRRKIQHLLSLVEPVTQDVTYARDKPPNTLTLHSHARAVTAAKAAASRAKPLRPQPVSACGSGGPTARTSSTPLTGRRFDGTQGGKVEPSGRQVAQQAAELAGPSSVLAAGVSTGGGAGDGSRVLRTVYMPNEKVDSLLLTVESLRAQLQQQEKARRKEGRDWALCSFLTLLSLQLCPPAL